jgi:hypothetical protein
MWPWKIGIRFSPTEKGLSTPPADFTSTKDSLESNPFRFHIPPGPRPHISTGELPEGTRQRGHDVHDAVGCNT